MVEQLGDLSAGVLGFRATGTVTRDEFREMLKPIYAALERGEKLNIYLELAGDFDGLGLDALSEDLKAAGSVGLKYRSSWQKVAVVTDNARLRHAAAVFGPLAPGELRLFDPGEAAEAQKWSQNNPRPE